MFRGYVRSVSSLGSPGVIYVGRMFANAAAERLFAADASARAECQAVLDAVRVDARPREALIAGRPMVFFPIYDVTDRANVFAGLAGTIHDLPRLLHDIGKDLPLFGEILRQIPSAILTARGNGQLDYVSARWYELTGTNPNGHRSPEDALSSAMTRDDFRLFSIAWTNAVARGSEFTFPVRFSTPQGRRTFELSARPIRQVPSGSIVKWTATVTDIETRTRENATLSKLKRHFEILAQLGGIVARARTLDDIVLGLSGLLEIESGERWFALLRHPKNAVVTQCNLSGAEQDAIEASIRAESAAVVTTITAANVSATHLIAAPIAAADSGEMLGFLGFVRDEPVFSDEDRALVAEVASRAALAVLRIMSTERDRELASMLQRSMLPLALPYAPGIRIDVAYEPAEREALVGGDWYDAFELPDGLIAIAIGDVAGHGFDAAVVMNQVRQTMRAAAYEDSRPAEILERANRVVNAQMHSMVTAFFGVLDPLTLTLTCASAGHLPPVFVDPAGNTRYVEASGTPLGVTEQLVSTTAIEELSAGGALVLYTDGVVEDERDFLRGERELLSVLSDWARNGFVSRASQLQSRLRTGDHRDDAAMFVLRFPHVDEFEILLPATRYNAQRLRLAARRFMAGSPFEEDRAFDAVLAIGEAVNNAVEHAYSGPDGFVQLVLKRESDRVIAEVRDAGTWQDREHYDRVHGLEIIEKLVDKVDIGTGASGTSVRMQIAYAASRAYQLASS